MNQELLQKAANQARGLAMDAIAACASGHLGLPLGCAEIGAVLFGKVLRINPSEPRWLNRDRFVLSAGHGSMFLYAWLHLAGFDLSLDDIRAFRAQGSKTPGHPEFGITPGVECTTGPLGQGVANAVGFAISAKRAAAVYNTPGHEIFDARVFCLAGDGCLEEGVAREAASLAGVLRLDNLILIYDSNGITLDAPLSVSQQDDMAALFTAMGWEVVTVDGHDMAILDDTLTRLRRETNGRPKFVIAKTVIARGVPEVEGTHKGHGEGGARFSEAAHARWGIPAGERFYVSGDVRAFFSDLKAAREQDAAQWNARYAEWRKARPDLAALLDAGMQACREGVPAERTDEAIPHFPADYADATRSASAEAINAVARACPSLVTASADLFSSNKNYIKHGGDYGPDAPEGRNLWCGIREHAMAALCNGLACDGLFRPSAATFCVFADYMRGAIRVSALSRLPVIYILTHDSIAVGEDGPTHQPVETAAGLRMIPNLDVIRPADPEESAGAWMAAMERADGPTALVLTRQKVPALHDIPIKLRRGGVLKGGYIALRETSALRLILLACGSELALALDAAARLGGGVRVVSMPSLFRFDLQSEEYRESVLPSSCLRRISIEAGVTAPWWKYVGLKGKALGVDRFGFSAPGGQVLSEFGMTVETIVDAAASMLAGT